MDKFYPPPPYSGSPNPLPGVAYSVQGVDYLNETQTTTVINSTMVQPEHTMVVQPQPTVVVQPQPTMVVQSQPTVMVQPQTTVLCITPGEVPIRMKCTFCQQEIITVTKMTPGAMAWLICIILFLFLIWPFCLIPFCVKSCNNVKHTCPLCRNVIHIFHR